MTDNEIRIAIAEACGWTDIIFRGLHAPREMDYAGRHPSCVPPGQTGVWMGPIPDYCNDLNAMHGAMLSLESSRPRFYNRSYVSCLQSVMSWSNENGMMDKRQAFDLINATARQRAEAFLRTIDKWKEASNG